MAISETHEYDPDAQLVTIRDPSGMVIQQRPYTPEEVAAIDAHRALVTNKTTLRENALAAIPALTTSIETLKAIADKTNANIGPADTKTLAKEIRQLARQQLRLTRLMMEAFETADVGAE